MTPIIWVVVGGAIGAPARYLVDRLVSSRHRRDWPWGTFTVNVSGAFLFAALLASANTVGANALLFLGVGVLGAFTTWSTFTVEVVRLAQEHQRINALSYLLATLVVGISAAYAGFELFA